MKMSIQLTRFSGFINIGKIIPERCQFHAINQFLNFLKKNSVPLFISGIHLSLNKRRSCLISLLQQRQRENKILIHGISSKHRRITAIRFKESHYSEEDIFGGHFFLFSDGNAIMTFSAFHACISDEKIFLIIESLKYRDAFIHAMRFSLGSH